MDNKYPTFSALLIEALKVKEMTVEQLAEKTGISERFITLLLKERLQELPSFPYLRGYIFKIADILGIDGAQLWKDYFKNNELLRASGHDDRLPENRFALARISKKALFGIVIFVGIVAYFIVRSLIALDLSHALTLPDLKDERVVVYNSTFEIRGTINPSYQLTVNNEPIYADRGGMFQKILELQPGFNTVVFEIKGFLGKTAEVTKQLFYEPRSELNTTTTNEEN